MKKIKVLTLAETSDGEIVSESFELLAWARSLLETEESEGESSASSEKPQLEVISILPGKAHHPEELCYRGADRVIHLVQDEFQHFLPEVYRYALLEIIEREKPDVFLASATTTGRTIMPYLASKLRTGLTADCTKLRYDIETGKLLQTRPAVGGNVMATIKTVFGNVQMATVRPNSMRTPDSDSSRMVQIESLEFPPEKLRSKVRFLKREDFDKGESLHDARIIVSGGKGLKKAENFKLIEELAKHLGAGVGASREAVDRGWITYPHQVGLSGKTVTPEIYIAIGISGAIQHLAGMQSAESIISINIDPDAQIFSVSDFGIVGDLFEILPRLIEKLKERKKRAPEAER